ncbi:unnamed protein product [Absidia cylindrospora]
MTIDNSVEQCVRACNESQQEQKKPFQFVLVDIKKAAKDKEIHCIEKPLEGNAEELSFVALSYRWGEVQETMIDTHLGYVATITSFDLKDFYSLCRMMTIEPDLGNIQYVWVDAICVDQTNYERRKATIHHMTDIYEKATYILAVPDLHRQHLESVSTENKKTMLNSFEFGEYIYHLLHGNTKQLRILDNEFLNISEVPEDHTFRQLLATNTIYLADGFTKFHDHDYDNHHPEDTLDLLCEIYQATLLPNPHEVFDLIKLRTQKKEIRGVLNESLLHYNKVATICSEKQIAAGRKLAKMTNLGA